MTTSGEDRFWQLADDLLARPGVTRSTMMGFPCLRLDGDFFASWDPQQEALIVKLDAASVTALIDSGRAEPFAPNGRRFREWALAPQARRRSWRGLLDRAFDAAVDRRRRQVSRGGRRSAVSRRGGGA